MFGYKPDRGFFLGLCGGGTPTSWRRSLGGGCVLSGRDPQYTDYNGVTLDQNKGATAVVYVDVERAAAADPELAFDLELSATRAGVASLGQPVVVSVRNPPRSETSWVRPFERDGKAIQPMREHFGERFLGQRTEAERRQRDPQLAG